MCYACMQETRSKVQSHCTVKYFTRDLSHLHLFMEVNPTEFINEEEFQEMQHLRLHLMGKILLLQNVMMT